MITINDVHHRFSVDVEATKAYYERNTLCECDCCRHFYSGVEKQFRKLAEYLRSFCVDISRPDEAMSYETDGAIEYISVDYTVCGTMIPDAEYETSLGNDGLTIKINNGFVSPNEQTGNYFTISVEGIRLPYAKAGQTNRCIDLSNEEFITVPDTSIRAVNRGKQENESSGIVYCDGNGELHTIDFEACAINFKAEHKAASGNCIGERRIDDFHFIFYTSGIKTKIVFEKENVCNLFRHHLLSGKKVYRFLAFESLINETRYTTYDLS